MSLPCPVCGTKSPLIRQPDVYRCGSCGELWLGEPEPLVIPEGTSNEPTWKIAATGFVVLGLVVAATLLVVELLKRII